MTTFTTTKMIGGRTLVRGTDVFGVTNQAILDSTQWDEVNADKAYSQAAEDFDAAVAAFFEPLTKAAEAMHQSIEVPTKDSVDYIVLAEEVEGVQARPAQLVKLSHDSVVLRLIEQGDFDRLVWVGDSIEVLAAGGQPVLPVAPTATGNGVPAGDTTGWQPA